jgi:hypothetical protein
MITNDGPAVAIAVATMIAHDGRVVARRATTVTAAAMVAHDRRVVARRATTVAAAAMVASFGTVVSPSLRELGGNTYAGKSSKDGDDAHGSVMCSA